MRFSRSATITFWLLHDPKASFTALPGKPLWPVLTLQVSSGALLPGQNWFWPSVHSGPEKGRIISLAVSAMFFFCNSQNTVTSCYINFNHFLLQLCYQYQWCYQVPGCSRSIQVSPGLQAWSEVQMHCMWCTLRRWKKEECGRTTVDVGKDAGKKTKFPSNCDVHTSLWN